MEEKYIVKVIFEHTDDLMGFIRNSEWRTHREFGTYEEVERYINRVTSQNSAAEFEITKVTYEEVKYTPDPLIKLSKEELIEKLRKQDKDKANVEAR